jgi:hypothetical protein
MRAFAQARRRPADNAGGMRRIVTALALLGTLLAAMPAAPAHAAKKKAAKASTIKLVSPMRVKVGRMITIRGTRFSTNRRRNTVIFRSPGKRTAFAKPRRAGRRKLAVRVPASVERLLTNKDAKGLGRPTRFRVRVLVRRKYGKLSKRRNSPVIVTSLRGGAPASCGKGSDFDGDLLSNAVEASIKTDPCNKDTDGDGVEDGFEQESARDLNQKALPYPGKRPFPNALDASDAGDDYDGDGLSNVDEFRAWARAAANPAPSALQFYTGDLRAPAFGGSYSDVPRFGNHSLPLNYSDGNQATVDVRPGNPEYKGHLDLDGDGRLTDDERDADGDGLSNHDELYQLMKVAFYPTGDACGYEYTPQLPRRFLEPDYLDWDSDGDGVWDGNDDQDNDDVSNVDEILSPYMDSTHPDWAACGEGKIAPLPIDRARDGSMVLRHPYNPCLPYQSRTCNRYVPR